MCSEGSREMQRKKTKTDRNVECDGKLQNESNKSTEMDSASNRNHQTAAGDFPCCSCSAVLVTPGTPSSGAKAWPCPSSLGRSSEAKDTLQGRPHREPGALPLLSPALHRAEETSPRNPAGRGLARTRTSSAPALDGLHKHDPKMGRPRGWLLLGVLTTLVPLSAHLRTGNGQPEQRPPVHLKCPCPMWSTGYSRANSTNEETFLKELNNQHLGKQHYSLWEYQAATPKPTLLLLHTLSTSPRLGLLYLYYFDYTETFLPFIHTVCPVQENGADVGNKPSHPKPPTWKQWWKLLLKLTLAYQLVADFAWSWLGIHSWTWWFLVVNALLLSLLELLSVWNLWLRKELQTIPHRACEHFWHVFAQGLLGAILWHLIPSFIWKYAFYWKLYCSPVINLHKIVKELRNLELQAMQ